MKRKLCGFCALILAAVFVLSMFTGCEKKPAATTEQPTANPTEEPVEEYKPIMQRFEGADHYLCNQSQYKRNFRKDYES